MRCVNPVRASFRASSIIAEDLQCVPTSITIIISIAITIIIAAAGSVVPSGVRIGVVGVPATGVIIILSIVNLIVLLTCGVE